jgi:hypothetical protein
MARHTSVGDQIEFLAPNDTAFGMADVADFVGFDGADDRPFGDEPPRSRWLPTIVGLVIVGLVGAGIVAAAPWDDGGAQTTPTTSVSTRPTTPETTVAVSTPQPVTTTVVRPISADEAGPPGLVFDDPGPFRLASAGRLGSDYESVGTGTGTDAFDLWTSADAARAAGRWLAFSSTHDGVDRARPDSTRLMVNDLPALLSVAPDGVFTLLFVALDGTWYELMGFGFGLPDLVTIAAHISLGTDGTTLFGTLPDGIMGGLTHAISREIQYLGEPFDLVVTSPTLVSYDTADATQFVGLGLLAHSAETDALLRLMPPVAVAPGAAEHAILDEMDRTGAPVQIAGSSLAPDYSIATWSSPAGRVFVWGYNVPIATLVAVLPQVRLAGDAEWLDMLNRSAQGELQPADGGESSRGSQPTTIGVVELSNSTTPWRIEMMTEPSMVFANNQQMGWGNQLGQITSVPTLHRMSSPDATFLIATAGWPNEARTVRVTLDGVSPVEVPMVQLGDTPTFAVVYAYDQLIGGTIEFLALDGTVLASEQFAA